MGLSNVVALFIIITTAATLHAHNITDIQTSSQAAVALRPIAGQFAFFVFALGIIGCGLLAPFPSSPGQRPTPWARRSAGM